ncbi:MAG TPA: thioredoxin family protein [Rugosibacter sp.]|nr:thioredoxin family protein [Rhodocyclales bacterium]HPB90235.1 thioredoxin family protein [Rugosibacter sp.]HQQ34505.1 thioredoxin family protein [Rugosibacter sp.]
MSPATSSPTPSPDFLVACLCADWCGTCRDYRAGFNAVAQQFTDTAFRWIDIEDAADELSSIDGGADMDIENFPTLLIFNHGKVVFFGPMLPQPWLLERTFNALRALSGDALENHISASATHQQWQRLAPLHPILLAHAPA